jgi:predicted permease
VLLIACANAANLFLVRVERRAQDHAVQHALGGTRARLIRVGVAEALIVALLAGGLAILLAQAVVPLFLSAAPEFALRLGEIRLSTTLTFTFVASLFTALLCGLAPAVRAAAPPLERLREGTRTATRHRHWARNGLVVAQTALALVLLTGSALLLRSFWATHQVNLGFEPEDIITFQFAPDGADLVDGPAYARLHMEFMERLAALADVEAVGVVNNVPLDEPLSNARFVEEDATTPDAATELGYTYAGGDYFLAMGIDVQRGRAFTRADHVSDFGNVIVSRSTAEALWPGQDPIGRRLRFQDGRDWWTVVGVVEDVAQYAIGEAPTTIVYFPLAGPTPTSWRVSSPGYVVKTRRADVIAPEIRDLVRRFAPGAPVYRVLTMDAIAADEVAPLRFTMLMLGSASLLALLLGSVGLFGVLSYVVAERTREIGIRISLGAEVGEVRRLVVGQAAWVVSLGVALGLVAATLSTRVLQGFLFGVRPVDLGTFTAAAALMLGVGMLASYLPARRASSVDPLQALRGG